MLCDDSRVNRRVLIVDDHDGFRSFAAALLQAEGFEVVGQAADGESALEAAERLRPDLVLLDVQLPDLDGFEVAERLTATSEPPAVVLVSTRDAAASCVSRRTTRLPSSNGSRLYSSSPASSMPTTPIDMAAASERPPMIVSAGCFSSIRPPSFQSSQETAVSRPRRETAGTSPAVIGPHPAGRP